MHRKAFWRPLVLILEDDVWLEARLMTRSFGMSEGLGDAKRAARLRMISSWSCAICCEMRHSPALSTTTSCYKSRCHPRIAKQIIRGISKLQELHWHLAIHDSLHTESYWIILTGICFLGFLGCKRPNGPMAWCHLPKVPCDWQVISLRSQCPYGVCVAPSLGRKKCMISMQ